MLARKSPVLNKIYHGKLQPSIPSIRGGYDFKLPYFLEMLEPPMLGDLKTLGGGFKYFLFSPLFEEDSQFD